MCWTGAPPTPSPTSVQHGPCLICQFSICFLMFCRVWNASLIIWEVWQAWLVVLRELMASLTHPSEGGTVQTPSDKPNSCSLPSPLCSRPETVDKVTKLSKTKRQHSAHFSSLLEGSYSTLNTPQRGGGFLEAKPEALWEALTGRPAEWLDACAEVRVEHYSNQAHSLQTSKWCHPVFARYWFLSGRQH